MSGADTFATVLSIIAVVICIVALAATELRRHLATEDEAKARRHLEQAKRHLQWADDALRDAKAHYKASAAVLHDIDERVVEMRRLAEQKGGRR